MQLKNDTAFLRNDERATLFETFLNQLRILTANPPKGFDKFYEKSSNKTTENSNEKDAKTTEGTTEAEKTTPPPASKSNSDTSKPPPSDWNFGMFGPNPSGGPKGGNTQGQGRPIGGEQGPDQTKMIIFGALGVVAFIGALTFFEMGYKEISWKDFVNKFVKQQCKQYLNYQLNFLSVIYHVELLKN